MTERELREKIVKVLEEYRDWFIEEDYKRDIAKIDYTGIADALISAGFGDVKEAKFECDHYWRMWQGALVELERAEHRAEVAEREAIILSKWLANKTRKDYPYQAWLDAARKQAEKELAEEGKDD